MTATRLAGTEDIRPLVVLWKRFMAEESESVPDACPETHEAAWTARLRTQIDASKVVVVDTGGGELAGFFAFIDHRDRRWVPEGVAYVVDIYVIPEARTSTAANDLFHAAQVLLRAAYSETWTNTHAKNRRMRLLLKRAGFVPLPDFEIEGLRDQIYYRLDNRDKRRAAPNSSR
jgi:RimJ/RimL family protein N-acetyltransferase